MSISIVFKFHTKIKLKNLSNSLQKKFGRLDVLINNAGINMPNDFDKITAKDWDKIMNVNLKGPL